MSSRRNSRVIKMPAPYLLRIWLDASRVTDRDAYPFCLREVRLSGIHQESVTKHGFRARRCAAPPE